MTRPVLAPELRRYIASSVPSVPYLETVLLLRAEPNKRWRAAEMARRIYIGEAAALVALEAAEVGGIAQREEAGGPVSFVFKPASQEIGDLIDRLAAHYAIDVVTIADLIHSRMDRRAQQFADAFRWRKDD